MRRRAGLAHHEALAMLRVRGIECVRLDTRPSILERLPPELARARAVPPAVCTAARLEAVLTAFGVAALTFMMLMYALETRHRGFVLAFACGCALSSLYGFLAGVWPFGVIEAIWSVIALRRFVNLS